jgi:amidase
MYARQWNAAGIDAIICPASPTVASVHGESRYWGYTCVWNALDYSAAAIPCGTIRASDTWDSSAKEPISVSEADDWFRELYGTQGPERYANAPVGIQIVTRRFQEERLLQIVARVEASLSSATDPTVRRVASEANHADAGFAIQRLPHKDGSSYETTALEDVVAIAA